MLSWDKKITNAEETEHLLEAIFAAVELNEAELEIVTSAPSLYQRLLWRIGIGKLEEPQTEPIPFQHTWPSSSTPTIERQTPGDVFQFVSSFTD